MNVTRCDEAPEYFPPHHHDMRCVRLQGHEAGPSVQLWLGVSTLAPNGHTTLDASPTEKHYVVLEGEVTVTSVAHGQRQEATLRRHDSCRIAPGEQRQLFNHTDRPALVLLAMPLAPPSVAATSGLPAI
jgi:quercetin dioxygenase-like cupin family protein